MRIIVATASAALLTAGALSSSTLGPLAAQLVSGTTTGTKPGQAGTQPAAPKTPAAAEPRAKQFVVTGRLSGLKPVSASAPAQQLVVSITSTSGSPGVLRKLTATAGPAVDRTGAIRPLCDPRDVAVVPYYAASSTTTYTVPGKGTVQVPLAVRLLEDGTNQDACQGVTFPLNFIYEVSGR